MAVSAREFLCCGKFIAFRRKQIMHLHGAFFEQGAPGSPIRADRDGIDRPRHDAVMCGIDQLVAYLEAQGRVIRLAQFASALDDGLENRFDVGWGRRYDAENIFAARLIDQRLREVTGLRL